MRIIGKIAKVSRISKSLTLFTSAFNITTCVMLVLGIILSFWLTKEYFLFGDMHRFDSLIQIPKSIRTSEINACQTGCAIVFCYSFLASIVFVLWLIWWLLNNNADVSKLSSFVINQDDPREYIAKIETRKSGWLIIFSLILLLVGILFVMSSGLAYIDTSVLFDSTIEPVIGSDSNIIILPKESRYYELSGYLFSNIYFIGYLICVLLASTRWLKLAK